MRLKQAIHIPTGKAFFTSLFMALTFFLISLSVEVNASACTEEKQQKSKLLNQLPDDIRNTLIPIQESFYRDLGASAQELEIALNSSDASILRNGFFIPLSLYIKLNQSMVTSIVEFKREFTLGEREILFEYLYLGKGMNIQSFKRFASIIPSLGPILEMHSIIVADPFDKTSFISKNTEVLNGFSDQISIITDNMVQQMIQTPSIKMDKAFKAVLVSVILCR